jgi:hypothetical protein
MDVDRVFENGLIRGDKDKDVTAEEEELINDYAS